MKKVIKYLKNPKLIIIYLMNKNFFFFLSDKLFLKWKFKILMGYKLDLNNPQTFNEKLQWLKLYDRKPTHTSGDVYICTDKSNINYKELENKIKKWLKRKYFYIHREWPYKNVKPRIIIEEYLSDLKEGSLLDYKIFMFNEKLAYFLICSDRNTNLKFTFFDKNGKFINMTQDGEPNDKKLSLPDNYKEMVAMAKRISKGTIESRIDFYDINGKIYFGEITFFDSAGFGKFEPNEWDKKIGDMLKLPMKEEK